MGYELSCQYDRKQSFYGKAKVRVEGNRTILTSYTTDVAYIENGKAVVNGMYSNTTLRHIKEFLKQNGFIADSWKQIERDYSPTEEQVDKQKQEEREKAEGMMKSVGMVAMLGDLMTDTKKESNDWKLRMIKAGLGSKGLSVPEDWDQLTEEEKETRLNKVIAFARSEE